MTRRLVKIPGAKFQWEHFVDSLLIKNELTIKSPPWPKPRQLKGSFPDTWDNVGFFSLKSIRPRPALRRDDEGINSSSDHISSSEFFFPPSTYNSHKCYKMNWRGRSEVRLEGCTLFYPKSIREEPEGIQVISPDSLRPSRTILGRAPPCL